MQAQCRLLQLVARVEGLQASRGGCLEIQGRGNLLAAERCLLTCGLHGADTAADTDTRWHARVVAALTIKHELLDAGAESLPRDVEDPVCVGCTGCRVGHAAVDGTIQKAGG